MTTTERAFQPHACGCGCGHLVSAEPAFIPSHHPRVDLAATVEQEITDAAARAELEVRDRETRWRQLLEDVFASLVDHWSTISIECACCCCIFNGADEYRRHVAEEPSWCDRERWGSNAGHNQSGLPAGN